MPEQAGPILLMFGDTRSPPGLSQAPNAAYRHFASRQALLQAVRAADFARASVRAVGTGYLRFAQAETGLFRTAFAASDDMKGEAPRDPDKAGPGGLNPFELLGAALDKLVAAGVMPPERRPGAEFLA